MKTICPKVFLSLTLAAGLAATLDAATVNFDTEKPGTLPAGWVGAITGSGEAKWSVEKVAGAPSGEGVLKQSAWTPKPSYPVCVKPDVALKDGFVEVKFKALSGTNDQAAGLVWRYRDTNNYYVARANVLEDNVVLYKVEQGKRTPLDIIGRTGGYGVKEKVSKEWNTLRVEFSGTRFHVFLNGKEVLAVEDKTFADAGAVGVWTKADSVTLFDDFSYGALTAAANR